MVVHLFLRVSILALQAKWTSVQMASFERTVWRLYYSCMRTSLCTIFVSLRVATEPAFVHVHVSKSAQRMIVIISFATPRRPELTELLDIHLPKNIRTLAPRYTYLVIEIEAMRIKGQVRNITTTSGLSYR
mmetsp:Transcript_21493/g.27103  ORF Transcript_21493/g.27103 Transcript_21493/m.27103 type:complete len:131 (+) Transcript_21493:717-1109(+)